MKKFIACVLFNVLMAIFVGTGTLIYFWSDILPKAGEGFRAYCVVMWLMLVIAIVIAIVVAIVGLSEDKK